MSIPQLLLACATVLAVSTSASNASPCSEQIDRLQAQIDAGLEARAADEPSARESTAATMHRQPTPESMAAAETKLGGVSRQQADVVRAAVVRAREADRRGDASACEQAVAAARRALAP